MIVLLGSLDGALAQVERTGLAVDRDSASSRPCRSRAYPGRNPATSYRCSFDCVHLPRDHASNNYTRGASPNGSRTEKQEAGQDRICAAWPGRRLPHVQPLYPSVSSTARTTSRRPDGSSFTPGLDRVRGLEHSACPDRARASRAPCGPHRDASRSPSAPRRTRQVDLLLGPHARELLELRLILGDVAARSRAVPSAEVTRVRPASTSGRAR